MKMLDKVEKARALAALLDELEVPRRLTDGIRRWANQEQKRIRDKARG